MSLLLVVFFLVLFQLVSEPPNIFSSTIILAIVHMYADGRYDDMHTHAFMIL